VRNISMLISQFGILCDRIIPALSTNVNTWKVQCSLCTLSLFFPTMRCLRRPPVCFWAASGLLSGRPKEKEQSGAPWMCRECRRRFFSRNVYLLRGTLSIRAMPLDLWPQERIFFARGTNPL